MSQYPCETFKLRAHQDEKTKAAIREKYNFTKYK